MTGKLLRSADPWAGTAAQDDSGDDEDESDDAASAVS